YLGSPGSVPSILMTLNPLGTWVASTNATDPGRDKTRSSAIEFEKTILGPVLASARNTFEIQYWRSPNRTFRTSLKLRFSTGVSGPTTIAISPTAPAPKAGVSDPADA